MYVEAICPLCFASHVVPDDMRGEKFRCEECEEDFVISKKAKRTSKKPSRLREVRAADEVVEVTPVEAAEVGEVLPDAKLADKPPKKKPRADDDEVMEIPDDAVQGGAPVVKTTPASKRRRDDDEGEDRPKKRRRDEEDDDEDDRPRRRPPRRKGAPVALIAGLGVGAVVLLFGLCGLAVWVAYPEIPEQKPQPAQANNPPPNNGQPKRGEVPPPQEKGPPKADPPRVAPPKEDPPPKKEPPPKVEPPAGPWAVKADPPAVAVKMPAAFKKEVPAPGMLPELIFPTGPSPFVAIGSNRGAGDERQVWNLQTGQMTGKVVGLVSSNIHPVLSPDGAHLAFLSSTKRGTVEMWAPATGKMVSVQAGTMMTTDLIEFAGSDKLLAGRRTAAGMVVKVIDAATGKEEREFTTPRPWGSRDAVAVSPGGAYLAVMDRESLQVFDVRTGLLAGQRPVPKGAGGAFLTCHGLSYSPDGGELAALYIPPGGGPAQLVCWDMAKGDVVSEISIPKAMPPAGTLAVYRGHVIDWAGDRRGWLLYGYTLVDRGKSGAATFLPEPATAGSPIPRHLVGPGHAVTMAAGAKAGERTLTVSAFDPDKPQ